MSADLSSVSNVGWGSGQMDAMSGASSYVPSTSSDSAISQMRSDIQQSTQNFGDLSSALTSNNLTGATQAYATLQQTIQSASAAAGGKSPFDPNGPIGNDFQAIGNALQSGDLSGAKQAFAAFNTDIKIAGRTARAQNLQAANAGEPQPTTVGQPSGTNPASPASTVGGILNTSA